VPLVGVTAVGAITLDASGLSPGDYEVFVDSDLDFGTSSLGLGTAGEPLFGSAVVRVLPEPATLALLGVGASVCGRRAGRAGRMKSSVRQRAENRFLVATRIEAQSEPIRVVLNWTGGAIIPRHAGDSWNRGRRPEFVRLVTGVT
jgi:hypothetical protein